MFESFDVFRARCGEPLGPRERCPICAAIPLRCSRETVTSMVADYDVDYGEEGYTHDDIPPQVDQLELLFEAPRRETDDVVVREALARCPTCHYLYLRRDELAFLGARNYRTVRYDRVDDVDRFFYTAWCVAQRLPDRDVAAIERHDFFRRHVLVRLRGTPAWSSLDDDNHLVALDADAFTHLVARDPPTGLDHPSRARRYAELASEVDDPEVQILPSFDAIRWRDALDADGRDQVAAARAASRVEPPIAERVDDRIVVRLWVLSRRRLICRIVTVHDTGELLREDAVIAEQLPVA